VGQNQKEIEDVKKAIIKFNEQLPERAKSQAITSEAAEKSMTVREADRAKRELGIPLQNKNIPLSQEMQKLFPNTTFDVRKR
jgi:DNA-binding transcriptional regulator GbsR (MarR family)